MAVATTDAFADRTTYCVDERGKQIALIVRGGSYYALANRCTHQGGLLCEGTVEGDVISCSWHGARFEVDTGAATGPPAPTGVE